MTRTEQIINEHNNRIAVMQAYKDGETIEFKRSENKVWEPCVNPMWWWHNHDYRVKPREPRKFTLAVSKHDGSALSVDPIGSYPAASWDVIEVVEVIKE